MGPKAEGKTKKEGREKPVAKMWTDDSFCISETWIREDNKGHGGAGEQHGADQHGVSPGFHFDFGVVDPLVGHAMRFQDRPNNENDRF